MAGPMAAGRGLLGGLPAAGYSASDLGAAALVLAAVAAVAGAVVLVLRSRLGRGKADGPSLKLFDELCRAHGLSEGERSLLSRAGAGAPLSSAAFVDHRVLDRHAESRPNEAASCQALRERLFGF